MKINEIIISNRKVQLENIISEALVSHAIEYYTQFAKQTDNFTLLPHERYGTDVINDFLDLLYDLEYEIQFEFSKDTQTYKIIEWLIEYFSG